ncbi:MAG: DUF424 family protein, partial [Nanoarchaeota archaeon]|nr:DUF424 family protein [Nanoarchaeota archaeon]
DLVKTHQAKGGILLAVCDTEILGKKFETDRLQLDLTSNFYKGEEKTEKELEQMIKTAYMLNLVGKKSVGFAIERDLVSADRIITIQGVPHAQVVLLHN